MMLSSHAAKRVMREFSSHFEVNICSPSGTRQGADRRAEVMYVLRKLGMTFAAIGELFERDHTTVIAACRRIEEKFTTHAGYREEVQILEHMADGVLAQVVAERKTREKLPDERTGLTLHFVITTKNEAGDGTVDVDGYVQTGVYKDGRLGELFVKIGKAGEREALLDSFATQFSYALQYGAPLEVLCKKEINKRYEPSGATNVPGIPRCTSPTDLVCRWLLAKYAPKVEAPPYEEEEYQP